MFVGMWVNEWLLLCTWQATLCTSQWCRICWMKYEIRKYVVLLRPGEICPSLLWIVRCANWMCLNRSGYYDLVHPFVA